MDQELAAAFELLTFCEQWLAVKEIMKLHEMYALDCEDQPVPVPAAVFSCQRVPRATARE
jgi:hypothetical protein